MKSLKPNFPPLFFIFVLVALPVVIVDQISKEVALRYLENSGEYIPLLGEYLGLQLVHNPGAAFSIAAGYTWIFSVIPVIVVIFIGFAGHKMNQKIWLIALGTLAGGAIGNLIDRLIRQPGIFRGRVVDFINYHNLFVGNIADIAIVLAVLVIVTLSVLGVSSYRK